MYLLMEMRPPELTFGGPFSLAKRCSWSLMRNQLTNRLINDCELANFFHSLMNPLTLDGYGMFSLIYPSGPSLG